MSETTQLIGISETRHTGMSKIIRETGINERNAAYWNERKNTAY